MLLSCLVDSASLTYFSLLVPSLCALLQPLAQSGSTFLMWGRALRWGGGVECCRGKERHLASCSSSSHKHVFAVAGRAQRSHFPPLASHLQDVKEPQTEGREGVR